MNVPRNLAALLHVAGGDSAVLDSPYDHFPTSTAIGRVREADGGRTRESSAGSTMSLNQSGSTSTAVRKKRSASTEDAHVDTNDEGDEEDPGKPLKNTSKFRIEITGLLSFVFFDSLLLWTNDRTSGAE